MSWAFFRREWGAVTFVLTVVVGMIVVPLALYLAGVGPGPAERERSQHRHLGPRDQRSRGHAREHAEPKRLAV